MGELSVKVQVSGGKETEYRFSHLPIRVGRANDCDLVLCHAAIPRELCRVWLEDGGDIVRVEEKGNLTNALTMKNRPLNGGVSGPSLTFYVGPVRLICAVVGRDMGECNLQKARSNLLRLSWIVFSLLAILLAVLVLLRRDAETENVRFGALKSLPASPLCFRSEVHCRKVDDCEERARLYETRAKALEDRAFVGTEDRVAFVRYLSLARVARRRAGGELSIEYDSRLAKETQRLEGGYRRDLLVFERALGTGDTVRVKRAAREILRYIDDCRQEEVASLRRFLEGTEL